MAFAKCLCLLAFLAISSKFQPTTSRQKFTFGSWSCPERFNHTVVGFPRCYSVVTEPLSWDRAQDRCAQIHPDAHLVTINGVMEDLIIREILEEYDCPSKPDWYWTSGRRETPSCDSQIVWKPNTIVHQPLGYRNFCPDEPDCAQGYGGRQHCITVAKRCNSDETAHGWQEDSCGAAYCAVCEVVKFEEP